MIANPVPSPTGEGGITEQPTPVSFLTGLGAAWGG